jgi:hypothetical protein
LNALKHRQLVAQRDDFDLHRGLAAERGEKGSERY